MRRIISIVVALSLLLLPALAQPERPRAASGERLVNGDFEALTVVPWSTEAASLVAGDLACPPRPGSPGQRAGALTVKSPPSYGYMQQTVAVAPGETYRFNGHFLSQDGTGGSEVRVRVGWLDEAQTQIGDSPWLNKELPILDYTELTEEGVADDQARFAWIRIELAVGETTTLCVDDVSFSGPAPPPVTPTPVPSSTPTVTATSTPIQSPTHTPTPTFVPIAVGSLLNGGFEEASADGVPIGWHKYGTGDLSRSSATARSGAYSAAFRSEGDATKWAYQVVGVEPNQAYAFEGYVSMNGPPASQAYLRVSWYASADGSGSLLSSTDSPDALDGGDASFRYIGTGTVVAPADAHSAKLRVMLAPASSSSETIYLDDFEFFETAPPTATPAPSQTPTHTPTPSRTPTPVPTATSSPTTATLASPTAVPAAIGGLVNGGFEAVGADGAPVGWQKFGGALSRSSAHPRSGRYSGAFTSESEATKWVYQVVSVVPNQAYTFEGYVSMKGTPGLPAGQAGSLVYLRVSWYASTDGSGQMLSNSDSEGSLAGGDAAFRRLSTRGAVSPPAARSARVRIVLAPASSSPETIYLDDFTFAPSAAPPADGAPAEEPSSAQQDPQPSGDSQPAPVSGGSVARSSDEVDGAVDSEESSRGVKINEVCYDADHGADDYAHEWVELYNAGSESVELAGWALADNTSRDSLPGASLEPGAFAVVAAGPEFEADHPAYEGLLIVIEDGKIGNGLSNQGDRLALLDGRGRTVDALSYGDDSGVFQPSVPPVEPGHCLERESAGFDTDTARDFRDISHPSPGTAPGLSEAAGTPTATSSAGSAGISLVRGLSDPPESAGEGGGVPWTWVLVAGLFFVAGTGVGAGVYRLRSGARG